MSDLMASALATFLDHRRKKHPYHHNPPPTPFSSLSTHDVLHPPLHPPPPPKRQRTSLHLNDLLHQSSSLPPSPLPLLIAPPDKSRLQNTNQADHNNLSPNAVLPSHPSISNQSASESDKTLICPRDPMIGDIPLLNYSNHSIATQRKSSSGNKLPIRSCRSGISKHPIIKSTLSPQTLSLLKETSSQKPKRTTPRPFACHQEGCSASFIKQNHLSRHIRIVHNKERPYHCTQPGCGSRFGSKSHLADHTRAVHMRIKLFKCEMCNASWSKRFNLKKHIRVRHLGEKPYRCQQCHLSFGTRSHATRHELKVHKRVLTDSVPQSKVDSPGT